MQMVVERSMENHSKLQKIPLENFVILGSQSSKILSLRVRVWRETVWWDISRFRQFACLIILENPNQVRSTIAIFSVCQMIYRARESGVQK